MIVLHTDEKAAGRLAEMNTGGKARVMHVDMIAEPQLDVDAVSAWIAANKKPELLLIDGADGKGRAQSDAFEALRRIAKSNGIDVHIAGDDSVAAIADVVIRNDQDMAELEARFGTGKKIVELMAGEKMTEFKRAEMDIPTVADLMASMGHTRDQAEAHIEWMKSQAVWVNNLYQVNVEFMPGSRAHVIIRRLDKQPVHNWGHFQEIKNRFLGEECEAVEMYPRESHLVDAKHHYHLWGYSTPKETFGIGFTERDVRNKR